MGVAFSDFPLSMYSLNALNDKTNPLNGSVLTPKKISCFEPTWFRKRVFGEHVHMRKGTVDGRNHQLIW